MGSARGLVPAPGRDDQAEEWSEVTYMIPSFILIGRGRPRLDVRSETLKSHVHSGPSEGLLTSGLDNLVRSPCDRCQQLKARDAVFGYCMHAPGHFCGACGACQFAGDAETCSLARSGDSGATDDHQSRSASHRGVPAPGDFDIYDLSQPDMPLTAGAAAAAAHVASRPARTPRNINELDGGQISSRLGTGPSLIERRQAAPTAARDAPNTAQGIKTVPMTTASGDFDIYDLSQPDMPLTAGAAAAAAYVASRPTRTPRNINDLGGDQISSRLGAGPSLIERRQATPTVARGAPHAAQRIHTAPLTRKTRDETEAS